MLRYGERWRSQRRMTHASPHKKASVQFWPLIVKQSRLALQRLLTNPDNFSKEFRRMSGATLLSAVYGYEVTSAHDPLVEVVENAINNLCEAAIPGNFFVNTMPWLRFFPDWFPGTAWKQTVKKWREERDEMVDIPFNWTMEQMARATASPSVLKGLLSDLENSPVKAHEYVEEEDRIKWMTATLFGAGADTSAATTLVFILAMVLYPEVQVRAQAEIDTVIGRNRLPEMDDRESLPYVECLLKEVLRWQSAVPLAIPHACMEDDEYRGYQIPKGAIVIGNVWYIIWPVDMQNSPLMFNSYRAISNDKSVYANPGEFNPDRFLDPTVPSAPAFGFGRRSCPGVMAESALFITISSLLAVFDIRPARDDHGNDILPSIKMKSNALVRSVKWRIAVVIV
ncbi:hypothetical protein FRC10_008959 [Ceratobasidium sp. 414]|nr:hypothetical protein FRC10_008959 [Ceratobasidium sp. 414]